MKYRIAISGVGAVASAVAAVFWWRASWVELHDQLEAFISDLHRAGELNSIAALAACVGAVCGFILFACEWRDARSASK